MWLSGKRGYTAEVPVVHPSIPSPFTPPVLNPEIEYIGDEQKFQVDMGSIVHGGHEVPGHHVQVVLEELGGEGVHEALDMPVVVEHVEEGLGPVNPVHLTEDEVYDRLMAMCDESIAKVHWIDKYKTELVKFENKGFVEDMEDIAGGGGMNLNNEPDARGVEEAFSK